MKLIRRFVLPLAAALTMAGLVTLQAQTAEAAGSVYNPFGPSCGGTTIYKADGTAWKCTFDDEFNGTRLDTTKWIAQNDMPSGDPSGTYACMENSPNNVSVSGGYLHLSLIQVAAPVKCSGASAPTTYTTGQVSTWHLFSQEYGRFEARILNTATTAPGLQEDFWLWPDDRYTVLNWPTTGEIDVAELYSVYPTIVVPFLHTALDSLGAVFSGANTNTEWNCAAQRGVWNTYTLTWTATSITVAVNGTTCLVNTSANPAFNERYIVALTQGMGLGGNAPTPGNVPTGSTEVDYVRVWK